ncbi:glycosyltransferase [Ignavibacterium sp.]|uniref:glycosyltransferase n=1 Tax=Ignavibacterium sp. TaxID=2651167 RepID=UPI00307E36DD
MIFVAIILPVLLLIFFFLITLGLRRTLSAKINSPAEYENISVIIAIKNEINNLPALINSLNSPDYQQDKYEIIFVDDNSEDDSYNFLESQLNHNYKIIKAINKKFNGKKGALDVGIKNAQFNLIAVTDADCLPEPHWLKSISAKISEGFDIIFGYSPLIESKSFVSKISSFENLRNYILYFASAGLQIPYSATARSFAFRKELFYQINGFENANETLSGDDDLLIREAVKIKARIGAFRFDNDLVYSSAPDSLKEYLKRKARHLKTSHHYLLQHKIFLSLWHSINIFSVYSIFLIPISNLFAIPLTIKIFLDVVLVSTIKKTLPHSFSMFEIIYLQMFYETFLIINFINSVFTKEKWK